MPTQQLCGTLGDTSGLSSIADRSAQVVENLRRFLERFLLVPCLWACDDYLQVNVPQDGAGLVSGHYASLVTVPDST